MAVCDYCKQEMTLGSVDCPGNIVTFPDGVTMDAIPYENDEGRRCHDCHVLPGGRHHPGCDAEICPRCKGQLIGCGCLDDEDEGDDR